MVSHGKNIVGCVYRPPNQNTAMFIDKFNNILSLITRDNRHCYAMGDLNLDFSNTIIMFQHRNLLTDYFHTLFFLSSPVQPSVLNSYSATLIEKIFTNNLAHDVFSFLIEIIYSPIASQSFCKE